MATQYRVGQRVRKVVACPAGWMECVPVGAEGTISALGDGDGWMRPQDYTVVYDGLGGGHGAMHWMLAPLQDPGFDAFMEQLKKLVREPIEIPREQWEYVTTPEGVFRVTHDSVKKISRRFA